MEMCANLALCRALKRAVLIADKNVNLLESRNLRTVPGYNAGPHVLRHPTVLYLHKCAHSHVGSRSSAASVQTLYYVVHESSILDSRWVHFLHSLRCIAPHLTPIGMFCCFVNPAAVPTG